MTAPTMISRSGEGSWRTSPRSSSMIDSPQPILTIGPKTYWSSWTAGKELAEVAEDFGAFATTSWGNRTESRVPSFSPERR